MRPYFLKIDILEPCLFCLPHSYVIVFFVEELVIKEPLEFGNKSFMAHLNEMPWSEPLLTEQIEKTLYSGLHMTFCKKNDDSWGAVSTYNTV